MASITTSGASVLQDAIKAILVARWQTRIDEIRLDRGISYSIPVPNSSNGYSLGRMLPRDSVPSVCIFLDASGLTDEPRFMGAPGRAESKLRIKIRVAGEHQNQSDEILEVMAEAARQVILKYWRAYYANILAWSLEADIDYKGSSIRERFTMEGLTSQGDIYPGVNDETTDLLVVVKHKLNHQVSYTP